MATNKKRHQLIVCWVYSSLFPQPKRVTPSWLRALFLQLKFTILQLNSTVQSHSVLLFGVRPSPDPSSAKALPSPGGIYFLLLISKDSLINWKSKNPPPEFWRRDTSSCILAALCVGRQRNVAGLCYGWMFLLYIVNRRKCWSFPVV